MRKFSPELLAAWTGGRWTRPLTQVITGFAIDSRNSGSGDCFVAVQTDRRDGHDFVPAAASQGAVAALVRRPVRETDLPQLVVDDPVAALQACAKAHRDRFSGIVIGLSGSAGKTSTKELLTRMLGIEHTHATVGNLNNYLGVPLTLLGLDDSRHRFAVIEVGINQPREMELLASLVRPNVGLVTNVGAAHLEGLASLEQVAEEKIGLLRAAAGDGFTAYPEDCDHYAAFRQLEGQKRVVGERTQGQASNGTANVIFQTKHKLLADTESAGRERQAVAPDPHGEVELSLHLPGRPGLLFSLPSMPSGMRMNAVLAATIALSLGISKGDIQAQLTQWKPAAFRGEVRTHGDSLYYLDCYNANPLSMRDALSYFSERYAGRPRLFVIGSMRELGQAREKAHRSIGESLRLSPVDRAIFIGESADLMLAGALAAGNPPDRMALHESAEQARSEVAEFSGAIFLKGSRAFKLETLFPAEEGSSC